MIKRADSMGGWRWSLLVAASYVVGLLSLGMVAASRQIGVRDIFCYSAEVFSTLGLGDLHATSDLRMLTSVEAQGQRMRVCDPIAGALSGRARAPKPCGT